MFNNISSCASQNSIFEIISSNMDLPSSSSSTFMAGGRALDRHNPIITDEKRSGGNSKPGTPLGTPCTHNILQQKPLTPVSSDKPKVVSTTKNDSTITRKKKGNRSPLVRMNNTKKFFPTKSNLIENNQNNKDDEITKDMGIIRKSISSKPCDLIMKTVACKSSKAGVDYYSPPESSRYLLDNTSFLDVLSDFDPSLKYGDQPSITPKPTSSGSSDQVVVLSVSLHCRGCERKMKKHISRMPGITSFNIDFAAKKVTVIGNVTPLGVLASISKLKNAKLWAPPMPSSRYIHSTNIEVKM